MRMSVGGLCSLYYQADRKRHTDIFSAIQITINQNKCLSLHREHLKRMNYEESIITHNHAADGDNHKRTKADR